MFTSGFKPRSTSKKAKSIIRNEIKHYYGRDCQKDYGVNSSIEAMRLDANACTRGRNLSDWDRGRELAKAGNLAYATYSQRVMLSKIYGKKNVSTWNDSKVFDTYTNLIGREYADMLREQRSKKRK